MPVVWIGMRVTYYQLYLSLLSIAKHKLTPVSGQCNPIHMFAGQISPVGILAWTYSKVYVGGPVMGQTLVLHSLSVGVMVKIVLVLSADESLVLTRRHHVS